MRILKDVVAVRPLDVPLTSTLIEIPESADQNYIQPIRAKVVEMGTAFRHKGIVSIGDTVLVPNHLGTKHIINGELLKFYDGEDVLAIISE